MYREDVLYGYVIGETTPVLVNFISVKPPRLGEYVLIEHDEGLVLAMVEASISGNPFVPESIKDLGVVEKTIELVKSREYVKGKARLLTLLESISKYGKARPVKTPPKTGARVFKASSEELRKIFAPEAPENPGNAYVGVSSRTGYVRIGVLANHPDVPVYVKIDPIVARHLAILAVTGAGKSNTVSILSERIVRGLGGTVLIFDMHSEYSSSEIAPGKVNVIAPKIDPIQLSFGELKQLAKVEDRAVKQERALRIAYKLAKKIVEENPELRGMFIELMIKLLEYLSESKKSDARIVVSKALNEFYGVSNPSFLNSMFDDTILTVDKEAAYRVAEKLDDMRDTYSGVLTSTAINKLDSLIKPGYLNVLDLGEIDEAGCDVVVSYYTRRILQERKKFVRTKTEGYPSPILLVLEEAHILVPREEDTFTKYWIARVAREGRKFGVGVCLVSQRPKSIDENALSQTNNKIILKIVEPNDKYYVQRASEQLSDELLELLPSLNVGEAIIIGELTPLPALVKIDEHPGKKVGRDLKVTEEWIRYSENTESELRELEELIEMQNDIE